MKKDDYIPGFFMHDLVQVIVGSTLLAIPVGFTTEVWNFSEQLPFINVLGIFIISFIFISIFTYYHYHGASIKKYWIIFTKRVILTYIFSFIAVCIILGLVDKISIIDFVISLKRIIIVTLPASMSAAVADTIK
ncbi:MAG: DUF2391 family protein [Nanoarchaeota archaeon]